MSRGHYGKPSNLNLEFTPHGVSELRPFPVYNNYVKLKTALFRPPLSYVTLRNAPIT